MACNGFMKCFAKAIYRLEHSIYKRMAFRTSARTSNGDLTGCPTLRCGDVSVKTSNFSCSI